jgi:hypothetical protein
MVRLDNRQARESITDKINRFQISLGVILRRTDPAERRDLLLDYTRRAYSYMSSFLRGNLPVPLEVYDCHQKAKTELEGCGVYDTVSIVLPPKQQKEYDTRYQQSRLELATSELSN